MNNFNMHEMPYDKQLIIQLKDTIAFLESEISDKDKETLNLENGVKIIRITEGKLRDARLEEGFIITHIDKIPLESPEDLVEAITNTNEELLLEGIYPDGQRVFYQLDLEEEEEEEEDM